MDGHFIAYVRGFLASHSWENGRQIIEDACEGGTSRRFVEFVLGIRITKRRRQTFEQVVANRNCTPLPRWLSVLQQEIFNIWRVLHLRAAPLAFRPAMDITVSQRERKLLARFGIVPPRIPTLQESGVAAAMDLWNAMSIAFVGIWMDNFFRKRFLQNPDGPPGHLDCSAVAVLFTILLPRFPGHLTLRRIVFRLPGVMRCIRTSIRGLLNSIAAVTDGTLQAHFIRAPLDIARGIVHPQIWKPMLLDECRTSTNTELLQLIEMMRRIQIHTGRDLPLLVNMKIHASVLRFMYGAKLRSLDYRSHLERIPLLYGIWHPYKYCVHITFRRFFPVISWLLKPFITVRTKIPCHRKLIYMEKVFAGLLLASNVLKGLITEARDRLSTLRRPMNLENTVAYQKIQSLYSLLFVFTPALWAIGYGVRECTWAGAALDSGKTARTVLEHCLLILVSLTQKHAPKIEYVRTLCTALGTWQLWYDMVPGCLFVEESCEASLSRLGHALTLPPHVTDLSRASDVYCTLPPLQKERVLRSSVQPHLVTHFVITIRSFVQRVADINTPFTRFQTKHRTVTPDPVWDPSYLPPLDLTVDSPLLDMCMIRALKLMCKHRDVTEGIHEYMTHIPRTPLPDRVSYVKAWKKLQTKRSLEAHPPPDRYQGRLRRQPRGPPPALFDPPSSESEPDEDDEHIVDEAEGPRLLAAEH